MKLLKYCVNQKMNANSVKSVFQGPVKGLKRSATVMQDALAVKNASMDFAGQHLERVNRRWWQRKGSNVQTQDVGDLVNTAANAQQFCEWCCGIGGVTVVEKRRWQEAVVTVVAVRTVAKVAVEGLKTNIKVLEIL